MQAVLFFVGQVLPYIALVIFLAGVGYRVGSWLRAGVPLKLPLFPAPKSIPGTVGKIAGEVLLFKSLYKADRKLWTGAWLFHVALALIIIGHVVGIWALGRQFTMIGLTSAQSEYLSAFTGTVSGLLALAALVYLLFRRLWPDEVKLLSDPIDYFDLFLLLAIIITGNHMRFMHVDLALIRSYMAGLLTLKPVPIPAIPVFIWHFTLVQVLLMYFPFSKLMHLFGMVATRSLANAPWPPKQAISGQVPSSFQSGVTRGV